MPTVVPQSYQRLREAADEIAGGFGGFGDLELKFREELAVYEQKEKPMTIETLLSPYEMIMQERSRQEGLQTGRQEGLHTGLQEAVLTVLEARFGTVPEEVVEQVRGLGDEAKLRCASRLAATVAGFGDYLARA